jgi:ATP-dependent Clp protease ATP-binding subunit ClpA
MVYEDEAEGFFRPEFLNRIDAVVTFEPLNQQTASVIVAKELAEVAAREGLVKAGLRLSWTERLVQRMVEVGIDQRYGARPLQRTLEAKVVGPLARFLLERPGIQDRGVHIDVNNDGGICFALGD